MTTGHCPCTCHANGAYGTCSIEGGCGHLHAGSMCATDCGQPAHNGSLCPTCDAQLAADLEAIPDLWADLQITVTRQDRFVVGRDGGRNAETPTPFNPTASARASALHKLLRHWVRDVEAMRGHVLRAADHPPALAACLLRYLGDIRRAPDAGHRARALRTAIRRARHATDVPTDGRAYMGECVHELDHTQACSPGCERHPERCGADLYAIPPEPYAECTRCLSLYDVPETQAWMRDQVRHEVGPARLIAGLLSRLGRPVTTRDIHGLARAQLLDAAGEERTNRGTYRTYRAGDVLDALEVAALDH